MAFVNEDIPAAERAGIDWKNFAPWFSGPASWTIDRSRNVFLVRMSHGHPDGKQPEYGFYLDGHFCSVQARPRLESIGTGHAVHWEIFGIGIPDDLLGKVQSEGRWAAFMEIVKEALIAHGRWLYKSESVDVI